MFIIGRRWLSAAKPSMVEVSRKPNDFTMWCCLEQLEWTKRTSVYKTPVLPRPANVAPPAYDETVDQETQRVLFHDARDAEIFNAKSINEVDALWRRCRSQQGSVPASTLLARSVAISKLANTKRELSRALGAFARFKTVTGATPEYGSVALNYAMQTFFHDPKLVFALLENSSTQDWANEKSYALALASFLHVELSDKTGYFIKKAFAQYLQEPNKPASSGAGSVGKVLTLMGKRNVELSQEIVEELLIAIAPHDRTVELANLFYNVLPEFRHKNPVAYMCLLYDAAMIRIRPDDCLKVLAEMEEKQVSRSVYHFILAASGLRRRAQFDWEPSPHPENTLFHYVTQNQSRAKYNNTHYGPTISPFHIITVQEAYEKQFQGEKMHPKMVLELCKSYATHMGKQPFGTTEMFLTKFVQEKLLKERNLIAWEERAVERLLERIARNHQLQLALCFAKYMGKVSMPRNTNTNNGFLTAILTHIRQVPTQFNGHYVLSAECMVRDMCTGESTMPKFKRFLQQRIGVQNVPRQGVTRLAPQVTKFCQPDNRTVFLLGAIYHAAQNKPALLAMERELDVREWAKPLQDLQLQMLGADEAVKLVGELQTTSTVDEHTIHWLVAALLKEDDDRLAEAVGNLIGFCRTYKLIPRMDTVKRLHQHAVDANDAVELGRIKDFCKELGMANEWKQIFT